MNSRMLCLIAITMILLLSSPSQAQNKDVGLRLLLTQSNMVLHAKAVEVGVPESSNKYSVQLKVLEDIKGNLKTGDKIKFQMERLKMEGESKEDISWEPLKFEKNRDYIVFLQGGALTDRWLGVQPFNPFLKKHLMRLKAEMIKSAIQSQAQTPSAVTQPKDQEIPRWSPATESRY